MIASRPDSPFLFPLCLLAALACAGSTPLPTGALDPLPLRASRAPDTADLAARDLARSVLAGEQPGAEAALQRLRDADGERRAAEERATGLLPYALDARNATLGDSPAWRDATRRLLERDDLDDALRERLKRAVEEDPLSVARARLRDARTERTGRRLNAFTEPLGRSLVSSTLLPLRLAQALTGLAVREHLEDDFSTPERQALEQWKRFIERNPGSREAESLLARVESDQQRWYRNQRDRSLRRARRAERAGDPALTAALASRALRYAPENQAALELQQRALTKLEERRRQQARSLEAAPSLDSGGRGLAVALLLGDEQWAPSAAEWSRSEDPARAALGSYALAAQELRSGAESASWQRLAELSESGAESAMARHARALLTDAQQNPHAAFREARAAQRNDRLRHLFLGPLARGARDRDLPRALEWVLEAPSLLQMLTGFPGRLLGMPVWKDQRRSPGVFARRYLERFPRGEHAPALRRWLEDYEAGRGNWLGALRLAENAPYRDSARLAELRPKAAAQALAATKREARLDARVALLARVARDFEGTPAASQAGVLLRGEIENATAQRIRFSRGFLQENPELVGADGLALRRELLDGDAGNGETHEEGIALLGGLELELAFLNASGDEEAPPERVRRSISAERLARFSALLQETTLRNALEDPDDPVEPDAERDLFLERARLGLAESAPQRPGARSTYAYRGMRERYGLVRSRESILPVELVLQGSFEDLSLGAFPRILPPKASDDAFLYRR